MSTAEARPRTIALIVAVAMFMGILEGTIIGTALPHMASDFAVRPIDLSAGITAYLLVSAAFLPLSSWLAERLGTRNVFAAAILGFAGASLLCGASRSLDAFIAARCLQAFCASLMVPVGNLVLLRVTPKRELVSIIAISTTPALIAPVVGPPLGGFITSAFGWQWIFYINLPLALVGAGLVLRFVPSLRDGGRPFDFRGFLLVASALAALVYGLDRLGAHPEAWRPAAALIAAGFAIGALAVRHSRSRPDPLVPLTALRHRSFATSGFGAGFLARLPFMGSAILLPLYFQVGFGFSAFETGLLLLAANAGDLALKPVASRALRWMGFRTALWTGAATMMLTLAGCALLTPSMPFWLLFAALFVTGMGRSVMFTGMMSLSFADVEEEELGGATVLSQLGNAISASLGISLAALILNGARSAGLAELAPLLDYRLAILVLTALGTLSIPLFARLPRNIGAEVSGHRPRALGEAL